MDQYFFFAKQQFYYSGITLSNQISYKNELTIMLFYTTQA